MASFEQMMNAFGVVTVMNACVYKLKEGRSYVGRGSCIHGTTNAGALKPSDFECTGLYLDTLKIANLTQEGPTKTITGGQYANPLLKYGKTMTIEMQDALGRAPVLVEFFGCDYEDGVLSVTDKFPGAFAIEGDTFFIDQKTGDKVDVHILIPQLLPDAILNLTQDAEGDAAVFDLNGTISVTDIRVDDRATHETAQDSDANTKSVFYQIRKESWFHPNNVKTEVEAATGDSNYHDGSAVALTKLETPVVTAPTDQQGSFTWTAVPNATAYKIEATNASINEDDEDIYGDVVYDYTTTTSWNNTPWPGKNIDIKVKALGNGYAYGDSEWSESVEYILA